MKKPFSKKWNPFIHNSIVKKSKQQKKLSRFRIRNITNGLTMPEIASVPICGAKRMEAAILFFDLKDFTAISSKRCNEDVLYILNTIIPPILLIIRHWRGEIEKNTGDGIMAIFGTETRDSFLIARDAIESAMAIRYLMLTDIRNRFLEESVPLLAFRIGIDMQEVLISRIGIEGVNHLVVVGDAANRASKLQELSPDNGICIGENFYGNLHPILQNFCEEGHDESWKWHYPETKSPYRFFHYKCDFEEPRTWMKTLRDQNCF
jgi:class 3 adenylate cyclase